MQYTIYIERDQMPDPKKYPDGIAWRSGIIDATTGEEIDSEGDIETFDRAKELLLSTIERLYMFEGIARHARGEDNIQ